MGWGDRSGMCCVRGVKMRLSERGDMCGVRDVGAGW